MKSNEFEEGSPEEMSAKISGFLNGHAGSIWQNRFVWSMARAHRTMQQSFTRLCVAWLEHLAEQDSCDLRNEASVNLAREFVEKIPANKRVLPFI
jgi:hypothetical protein